MTGIRKLAILLGFVVAIVAGVAAATAIVPTQGDDTLNGPSALQPDGNGAAVAATAPDPGGLQRLAVRVYRSKTGLTCPEAARTDGSNFGQVDATGKFRASDIQAAGSCIDLAKAPMSVITNNYSAVGDHPAYSVVFGVVSAKVRDVSLRISNETKNLAITNGAYLTPVTPDELSDAAIVATLQDGSTTTYALHPSAVPVGTRDSSAP
jgi:hypothetical protein